MTTTKGTAEVQDQFLDAARQSQAALIDGLRAWTEAVQQLTPAQTAWPLAELPTPTEVVDSVFDFAAQLLSVQREFAHSVLGATAPLVEQGRQEAATTQQAQKATKDA